jgi:cytochrome c oxidase subunit 2
VLLIAVSQGRARAGDQAPVPQPKPGTERWANRIVSAALIATFVLLSIFVGASYATDRRLLSLERDAALNVKLTAHQWWWEIRYDDPVPSKSFTTANELHLPLGQRVKIDLSSTDVIHSVWLPNLNGKRDVIPGHDSEIWLTVTEPGEWRGRCAEFCGYQHAHMNLLVIAEPPGEFDRWRAEQAGPAASPGTDEEKRGEQVFGESACVLCHVIRGSPAAGYSATAPDLTHLKSRRTLAAGTLPNTKGHLGGWIADPQSLKPGVRMPVNALPPDQFQALLAYLEILR